MSEQESRLLYELNEKEKQLIRIIRRLKKGELIITVAGGLPVKVDDIKRNIEL
jgi:preprotein translocase subunit YajC